MHYGHGTLLAWATRKRLMVTSIGVGENGEYENMGAHCAAGTSPLRFFGFGDIFYQAQILS
jgi:hypothetical protein